MKLRNRIRKQSKEVAEYMENLTKYNVIWTCPECGNCHKWWWAGEHEAYDGETLMLCDHCDTQTWCKGDGRGFYEPNQHRIDELRPQPPGIEQRVSELESLKEDLYSYVRGLEDKVNTLTSNLQKEVENLGRRTTDIERSVWSLENDIKVPGSTKLGPQHVELAKEKEKNFFDLINGEKPPFHERVRGGWQLMSREGEWLISADDLLDIADELENNAKDEND